MDSQDRDLDDLLAHRARFVSFVRARVADRGLAEDIVHNAFAQAVQDRRQLTGADRTRWFYRVLRNGIIDRHRRAAAESRGLERWQVDPTVHPATAGDARRVCGCVRSALSRLAPKSRAILEAVELAGMTPASYGKAEGISAGTAAVRLHRARRLLADGLKGICGTCTLDGCADCDCGHRGRAAV